MKTGVIVLGVSRYKFAQDGTGEVVEGCKVHYVEDGFENQADSIGLIPQTAIMDYEHFEFFESAQIPGKYDAEFHVSLRGKKPTLKVGGFTYRSPFSINPLTTPANVAK